MTEAEWLASGEPLPMLQHFESRLTHRHLRLFACACCRRAWNYLSDESRFAVEVLERIAEGVASPADLRPVEDAVIHAAWQSAEGEAVSWATICDDPWRAAADASYCAAGREAAFGAPGRNDGDDNGFRRETALFAAFLRDIFGNPFRPPIFDVSWRTSDVLGLARTIYDEQAFDRLPILADALMDAGCDDKQVLAHCRGPGPHVRGCWVVDLILGKN